MTTMAPHAKTASSVGCGAYRGPAVPRGLAISPGNRQARPCGGEALTVDRTMALKRMVLEIGMGTDIRGGDYTKAAVRALRDALWHNSLTVTTALGLPVDAMQVEVTIGVPKPDQVDKAAVLAVLPHGTGTVHVVEGGLEIANDAGTDVTVMAHAAAIVRLELA